MIARVLAVVGMIAAIAGASALLRRVDPAPPAPAAPALARAAAAAPELPRADVAPVVPSHPVYVEQLTPAHVEVIDKLHRQGLARDPEVLTTMHRHVRRYQTGKASRADAAAEFATWLRTWEARHPARADSARAAHRRTSR